MDKVISSVTQLYLKYKDQPEILSKLNFYTNEKLPKLLEEYSEEKRKNKQLIKLVKFI